MTEIWKKVPTELANNHNNVYASQYGRIKIDDNIIEGNKGGKGKNGYYKSIKLNNKTTYFHRLVYYAFSKDIIDELKNARIIFKIFKDEMIDEEGNYRNYLEDLILEKTKYPSLNKLIPKYEIEKEHPIYGKYIIGKWYDVYGHRFDKKTEKIVVEKYESYKICIIDNNQFPCVIKSLYQSDKLLKHISGINNEGPMITLTNNKKNIKYSLLHVVLASIFEHKFIQDTVDHINDDSSYNHIDNLQWLSQKDNSSKGTAKQLSNKNTEEPIKNVTPQYSLENEIWKILNKTTEISNYGRIRKPKNVYNLGSILRGKKYRYATVALKIEGYPSQKKKYYVHQLVWIGFNGCYDKTLHILHDDKIELDKDGCYRNWLCDLSLGNRNKNALEHHEQKRILLTN
jgi:hypothetical protein